MLKIVSWIRERDQAPFAKVLAEFPQVELVNARVAPVDIASADGLLLSGGDDISADFLRQTPIDPALIIEPDPARDQWEFAALKGAMERGLPILAICRGLQVLNVSLGGTLTLDIPNHDVIETEGVHSLRHSTSATHRFAAVNSTHHQALARVANGLTIEAWSPADDVIEQVRMNSYPWATGVQYHPERNGSYRLLFEDFIGHVADGAK
jgi:putative glutamine amidotransferase